MTRTIYCTDGKTVQSFKWDRGTLNLKMMTTMKSGVKVQSIALASPKTNTESLYFSVGHGDDVMKSVVRASGPKLETQTTLKLEHIQDECCFWEISSDPKREMLLVHPSSTAFIYVHVYGTLKKKIDLTEAQIPKGITKMHLIDEKMIIGNGWYQTVKVYDFVLDDSQCEIVCSHNLDTISAHHGQFGIVSLSSDPRDLYVITKTGKDPRLSSVRNDNFQSLRPWIA